MKKLVCYGLNKRINELDVAVFDPEYGFSVDLGDGNRITVQNDRVTINKTDVDGSVISSTEVTL